MNGWCARAGSSVPTPNDANAPNDPNRFIAGHSYYVLATIANKAVRDQRERQLLMPPATLLEDVFGPVDYRRGRGRPVVNLREAINALLRGELLGSPEASVSSGMFANLNLGRGTFFDAANGLITTWRSGQLGTGIFAAHLDLAMPEAGFCTTQQITGRIGSSHHAIPLDTGEVLIVYETEETAPNIVMKRGTLGTLNPNSPTITVTDTAAGERFPFAVAVGRQVLIFWHEDAGNTWQFKWYDPHNATHLFGEPWGLANIVPTPLSGQHAAVDSTDTVWVAYTLQTIPSHSEIQIISVPPGGVHGQDQPPMSAPSSHNRNPFVMVDNSDNIWVFWCDTNEGGIWYRRFLRTSEGGRGSLLREPKFPVPAKRKYRPQRWAMQREVFGSSGKDSWTVVRIFGIPDIIRPRICGTSPGRLLAILIPNLNPLYWPAQTAHSGYSGADLYNLP